MARLEAAARSMGGQAHRTEQVEGRRQRPSRLDDTAGGMRDRDAHTVGFFSFGSELLNGSNNLLIIDTDEQLWSIPVVDGFIAGQPLLVLDNTYAVGATETPDGKGAAPQRTAPIPGSQRRHAGERPAQHSAATPEER